MTVKQELNQQVANWNVLYTKLHHFHWYVNGPHFFTLHEKFEELYDEAADILDDFAERLLAIGGEPVSTMKESLKLATIEEINKKLSAEKMVQVVVDDFTQVINELKKGMEIAEKDNDEATSDMFLGLIEKLEKHNWMLRAFLQ